MIFIVIQWYQNSTVQNSNVILLHNQIQLYNNVSHYNVTDQ